MSMTPDLVSSTIVARSHEPQGLRTMMVASSLAHVVAIAALVIVPMFLGAQRAPETVMEVSLAGAPGVASGGRNHPVIGPSARSLLLLVALSIYRPPTCPDRKSISPVSRRSSISSLLL